MKKIGQYFILMRLGLVCLRTCVKSLLLGLFNLMPRNRADKFIRQWAQRLLTVVKAEVALAHNLPTLPKNRAIIYMCNHTSLFDIPLCCVALPGSVRMLAKEELSRIFLFGRMLKQNEFVFINRQSREKAKAALQKAAKLLESGIRLWAAPEGTRSRTGKLQPFKKGVFRLAIETKAIVIPVYIEGANTILPPKTWDFSQGVRVRIKLGEPIDTLDEDYNALALLHKTRQSMLALGALDF